MRFPVILRAALAGLVCAVFACATAYAQPRSPDPKRLQLASSMAMVFDAQTGKVLYAKNADSSAPIASITKLMTAMVVLDGKLPMEEMLTISKDDVNLSVRTQGERRSPLSEARKYRRGSVAAYLRAHGATS